MSFETIHAKINAQTKLTDLEWEVKTNSWQASATTIIIHLLSAWKDLSRFKIKILWNSQKCVAVTTWDGTNWFQNHISQDALLEKSEYYILHQKLMFVCNFHAIQLSKGAMRLISSKAGQQILPYHFEAATKEMTVLQLWFHTKTFNPPVNSQLMPCKRKINKVAVIS